MVAVLYCFLNSDVSPELLRGQSTHVGYEGFPKVPPTWILLVTVPGAWLPTPSSQGRVLLPHHQHPSCLAAASPHGASNIYGAQNAAGGCTKRTCSLSTCPLLCPGMSIISNAP